MQEKNLMTVELLDDAASEKTCESPQTMKLKEEFSNMLMLKEQIKYNAKAEKVIGQSRSQEIE